jgi:hypothetical protein
MKNKFKTYSLLSELSNSTRSNEEDFLILKELNESIQIISNSLCDDFFQLFEEKIEVYSSKIYFDNPDYRQSSSAFVFKANLEAKKEISIYIECLIDFQKIYLSCRNDLTEMNKNYVCFFIKKAYGFEEVAELRNIKITWYEKLKFTFHT